MNEIFFCHVIKKKIFFWKLIFAVASFFVMASLGSFPEDTDFSSPDPTLNTSPPEIKRKEVLTQNKNLLPRRKLQNTCSDRDSPKKDILFNDLCNSLKTNNNTQ